MNDQPAPESQASPGGPNAQVNINIHALTLLALAPNDGLPLSPATPVDAVVPGMLRADATVVIAANGWAVCLPVVRR